MSYFSDTKRCPYCRGDMLVTEHMATGSKEMMCATCGTQETINWDENGKLVHKVARPTAFVSLLFNHGIQEFAYYGKHPYKWLKDWKRNVPHMVGIILEESFGVVYNKKHKKLIAVFGTPTIYPDEYYEDDECFY